VFISIYCVNEEELIDLGNQDYTNEKLYLEEHEDKHENLTNVKIVGLVEHKI